MIFYVLCVTTDVMTFYINYVGRRIFFEVMADTSNSTNDLYLHELLIVAKPYQQAILYYEHR